MYTLSELEESKKIIFSMSHIIDSFVMFHYLSKELQEETNPSKLIDIFLHKVHLDSTFNMNDAQIFIEDEDITKEIILENNEIAYISVQKNIKDIISEFEKKIENEHGLCIKDYVNNKKMVIYFHADREVESETLKILEIYTILFISKLENTFLQENIKNQNTELQNKNRELLELQASLIQKEKLASIGQLSAGIAHELNNPIGFISGNFGALKEYTNIIKEFLEGLIHCMNEPIVSNEKKDKMIDYYKENQLEFILDDLDNLFSESEEGLTRVTNIIKSLKDFSKIDSNGEKSEYSFNQGIDSTLTILKNEYKTVANINLNLEEKLPNIRVNGGEINEVLLNIIINGVHAIHEKFHNEMGLISISTYSDNDYIYCKIKDNGMGIKKEILDKIFDPFFTTKPVGKGTGLGLNISYNIIEKKHHGKLKVVSEESEYTEFEIILPIRQTGE